MFYKITTPEQTEIMIQFIEKHRFLAQNQPQTVIVRDRARQLWVQLANMLNAIGPQKSTDQWKKVWTDKKYWAKKSAASIKSAEAMELSNPSTREINRRILKLLGGTSDALATGKAEPLSMSLDGSSSVAENGAVSSPSSPEPDTPADRPDTPNRPEVEFCSIPGSSPMIKVEAVDVHMESSEAIQAEEEDVTSAPEPLTSPPDVSTPAPIRRGRLPGRPLRRVGLQEELRRIPEEIRFQRRLLHLEKQKVAELAGIRRELAMLKEVVSGVVAEFRRERLNSDLMD